MFKSLLPAVAAFAFISCQNDGGGEGTGVPASSNSAADPSVNTLPMNTPTTTSSSQPGTTAAGLNPPHGEPGHVCEIPVGQPLDGSGSAGASPQEITIDPSTLNGGTTTITPEMTQPGAVSTTAPGMNPPHGEPGHVCEIPVGQPLP